MKNVEARGQRMPKVASLPARLRKGVESEPYGDMERDIDGAQELMRQAANRIEQLEEALKFYGYSGRSDHGRRARRAMMGLG